MKIGAKELALTSVASALSLIAFTLSVFVEPMTLSFYALSGIAMMIPLTKNYWKGATLGYIVVAISSFFINPINSVAYIAFFGLYAIIQWLLDIKFFAVKLPKAAKFAISWLIKLGYFQIVVLVVWKFMQEIIGNIVIFDWEITYWLIDLIGTIFFIAYDVLMHYLFKSLKYFVEHKLKR